ncbi:MAG: hypothetical protein ACM3ZC_14985 [Bacteroidota bacterium]
MPTCSFRELEKVCTALGLESRQGKHGTIWKGISPLTHAPISPISVHEHARGRDIPDVTLRKYVRELGFRSYEEFREYLDKL